MKNKLTVLLGKTCLSKGELQSLSEGDIVVTFWKNADPAYLVWNGQIAATGHVIVWDDTVGFRIQKLATGSRMDIPVYRKNSLIDILEIDLCLASQEADTEVLGRIEENSIIIFDKKVDEAGELQLNGEVIATGKVCKAFPSGDLGALEIQHTSIPESLLAEHGNYLSTGNISNRKKQYDKVIYKNFRFPDSLSKISVRNMHRLNMMFAENLLHLSKNAEADVRISRVDQVTFEEYLDTLKDRTVALVSFIPGKWNMYKNTIIELPSTVSSMDSVDSPDFRAMIQEAEKLDFSLPVFVGYEEKRGLITKDTLELALKGAWDYVAHVEPEVIELTCTEDRYRRTIAPKEMVCIVEFEVEGKENSLIVVYPIISIEELLPKLEATLF
jgi:flagellar motor switch/type III secretory pathway protein FliN